MADSDLAWKNRGEDRAVAGETAEVEYDTLFYRSCHMRRFLLTEHFLTTFMKIILKFVICCRLFRTYQKQ